MISKLRRKFILINMALVGGVLLIVFLSICMFSYMQQRSQSYDAMSFALEREADAPRERFTLGKQKPDEGHTERLPVFSVLLDENMNIVQLADESVDLTDIDVARVVSLALSDNKADGVIASFNLRYMVLVVKDGTRIAFVDQTAEKESLANLMITLGLVGLGGMLAFYLVSIFLSNWVLRPVAAAWRQQQQFVADASHELKTPLTVILANLGILRSHQDETVRQQLKWVDNTQAEAGRMKKLVDDLLFLAKVGSEQAQPTRIVFSISDAVWSCLLPFEPIAFERGVTLSSDIEAQVQLLGDEAQIKQLIMILLDNACKFAGHKGEAWIRLRKLPGKVLIAVHNTGESIPAEQLAHVFDRFFRAEASRESAQGGQGLGLAIASEIVKTHSGSIGVTSDANHGTVFSVELPM